MNLLPRQLRSQGVALTHDLLMVPLAWFFAYWLRFNLETIPPDLYQKAFSTLIVILPVQLVAFVLFGLYRGVWRFASLPDILRIIKAVVFGVTAGVAVLFILTRADAVPRSVPVIYGLLLILFLGGSRLIYRWTKDQRVYPSDSQRVLIVGSGQAGEMLARDILRNRKDSFRPVAFVDDNPRRHGREIHGIPVLGACDKIPELARKLEIDIIMIAIPSAKSQQVRKVVELCEKAGVIFRSVPHLQDLMSGNVRINELREVSIEDLLGREQVYLDWDKISQSICNKTVLVTGGGGSIGSELCWQLAGMSPKLLVLLDHSEFNLYSIEMELRSRIPQLQIYCHLGDVCDQPLVESLFHLHQPEAVFHAAAYKHVPMLEPQIRQAMRNNVLGTRNVAETADRTGSGVFVLVSTDKAVNPSNVMGASKRAAEIFCQNLNEYSSTSFITVRFGNVLDSAGSVIPLFRQQIAAGGPVTVTDPRMERYFMMIPEACQLILQTLVLGNGGEIFVLDMGAAVKISYLAEQMIRLSGKVPGEDVRIEYIGLRPGEKLYEELFHEKEALENTAHEKVLLARYRRVDWNRLRTVMDSIESACGKMDEAKLMRLLCELVPEYLELNAVNGENSGGLEASR